MVPDRRPGEAREDDGRDQRAQLAEDGDADDVGDLVGLAELRKRRRHLEGQDEPDARADQHHDRDGANADADELGHDRGAAEADAAAEHRPREPDADVTDQVPRAPDEAEGVQPHPAPTVEPAHDRRLSWCLCHGGLS
jgi:hypothetical protein